MPTQCLDLKEYLNRKSQEIDHYLDQLIPERSAPYGKLFEAARYSLLSGGKKIRPILAIATAETLSEGKAQIPLEVPCALEMIHTYSIIHDDLPCMDDDDFRRGKPSLHKKYDEGMAVLAGDFLLTKAFELVAQVQELSDKKKVEIIKSISRRSGGDGMIGGQVLDLLSTGMELDIEMLRIIHLNKTAAPIVAALECGAILADASEQEIEILEIFGTQLGLAFQIIDDVLDVIGDEKTLGKPTGSDQDKNKVTYVNLMGVSQAKEAARFLQLQALETLKQLPIDTSLLMKLSTFLIDREK
ncbi:MAG: polyprenyl synthetase family protein [Chlamydiales bacterium]